jgi:hypothetical protein
LDLFVKAEIELVHGWLVDPDSPEAEVLRRVKDYDRAVELIAEVDHLTGGKLVYEEERDTTLSNAPGANASGSSSASASRGAGGNYTKEQRRKIEDGERLPPSHLHSISRIFHLAESLLFF